MLLENRAQTHIRRQSTATDGPRRFRALDGEARIT
jgi:hypothetical protein